MKPNELTDYRILLKEAWEGKRRKNPAYSLRAFARDIGLAPSKLSLVLRGEARLGIDHAYRVASKIGLSAQDEEAFRLSAVIEVTSNPELQSDYVQRLQQVLGQNESAQLSLDVFRAISDWYHIPLLVLIDQPSEDLGTPALARRLGISTTEVDCALDRLNRLQLIERDVESNRWKRVDGFNQIVCMRRDEAMRKFHRQMYQKGMQTIDAHQADERVIGTETFALSPSRLKELERKVVEFKQEVSNWVDAGPIEKNDSVTTEVYHLQVHCFRITNPTHPKEKV